MENSKTHISGMGCVIALLFVLALLLGVPTNAHADDQFVAQIRAVYSRHPGRALNSIEVLEVFSIISAEANRRASEEHKSFEEELKKVVAYLAELQAKGEFPPPLLENYE